MFNFILISFSFSQGKSPVAKQLDAQRITKKIIIDGVPNLEEWSEASVLTGFIELRPNLGDSEKPSHMTKVYLGYNDEGIYFGGICTDSKDSISSELAGRDGFGNNDFIGIVFDTYKDRQNAFEYFLTPLNEQMDAKVAPNNEDGEDFSWNSVFNSSTKIIDQGWTFEVFIPFASIRFSKKEVQDWGINIVRRRTKTGEQFFWNPIDPNVNGFLTQEGYWNKLTHIKPPLRLQLSPYVSYYANHYPNPDGKDVTNQVNGGLDLKLGLNQAYTLDATLIPDFGQVQSDQRVLNLTPFEVRFNENRPFFTEGTELFNKGNYFYSRRIGGTPLNYYEADSYGLEGETLVANPSETKLINASKISGRGRSGLGLAVLNAVTSPSYATFENGQGKIREVETNPLTNYNIFVADQTLKNNSSISLINTSVLREGSSYDATVTAGLFSINNKANSYNVSGSAAVSNKFDLDNRALGYTHSLSFGRTSGRVNWSLNHQLTDSKFDYNDLGYFTNNNEIVNRFWIGTRWNKPKGIFNQARLNLNLGTNHLFTPIIVNGPSIQSSRINTNFNMQTKKLWWMGVNTELAGIANDYYEPRVEGQYFKRGNSILVGTWIESNSNKKYFVETEVFVRRFFNFYDLTGIDLSLEQNYRFNKKFLLSHEISYNPRLNSVGFSFFDDKGQNIFNRRDINTIVNEVAFKYSFTNRMGLTFVSRHYMSTVKSKELYNLQSDGSLQIKSDISVEKGNRNLNFFNIDMVYTWQIAQGSFVNIVWKNAAASFNEKVDLSYLANLRETLQTDQNNNISLKVIYFLDYNTIRKNHAM